MKKYPKGINENNFHFIRHETEPWTLIVPIHQAVEWHGKMVWYRSRVEHDDGRIVSMGFPKFFNLGERQDDKGAVRRACEKDGQIRYTDKRDGSLIIRSVFDGKVIVRTRGSFSIGLDKKCEEQLFECAPKNFLDSSWGANYSILYEFTSPDNTIVVPYKSPNLTCLGAVHHEYDPILLSSTETSALFPDAAIDWVNWTEATVDSIQDIIDLVEMYAGMPSDNPEERHVERHPEGIVLEIGGRRVKVKNSDYLNKHRLKYYLKDKELRYLCLQHGIQTSDQFDELTQVLKVDWEVAQVLQERFEQYVAELSACKNKLAEWKVYDLSTVSRKEIAQKYQKHPDFALIMILMDNNVRKLHMWVMRNLQLPVQASEDASLKFTNEISEKLSEMGFMI